MTSSKASLWLGAGFAVMILIAMAVFIVDASGINDPWVDVKLTEQGERLYAHVIISGLNQLPPEKTVEIYWTSPCPRNFVSSRFKSKLYGWDPERGCILTWADRLVQFTDHGKIIRAKGTWKCEVVALLEHGNILALSATEYEVQ